MWIGGWNNRSRWIISTIITIHFGIAILDIEDDNDEVEYAAFVKDHHETLATINGDDDDDQEELEEGKISRSQKKKSRWRWQRWIGNYKRKEETDDHQGIWSCA